MRRFPRFRLDRRAAVTVTATALAVLAPAGSASATTRYAANYQFTNNAGAAPCTNPAKPCVLTTALASAVSGDEVVLPSTVIRAPGFSGGPVISPKAGRAIPGGASPAFQPAWSDTLEVPDGVTLRGTDPAKLPVIVVAPNSQAEAGVGLGKNAKIRDVAISGKAADNAAITYSLQLGENALADRVRVTTTASTGVLQIGVSMSTGATLRSSITRGVGTGLGASNRVTAVSASSKNATATVRNVTAISTTDGGEGIATGTSDGTSSMIISNTIARGTNSDIRVRAGLSGGNATATVSNSNWVSQDVSAAAGATATLQQAGGNQNGGTAAEPNFFDAAGGDFRQMPGSPTIDAGVVDVNSGPLAFGGALRKIGITSDIGADEFDPASIPATPIPPAVEPDPDPEPTPEPTTPATPTPTTPVPPADTVKPVLSGLSFGKKSFKRSKGTTISFTLSEAAKVKLDFGQPKAGRLVAAKCVKLSAKNRKKPKCTQANLRGTLTIDGKAGLNTLSFNGTLTPKKRLAFGSYLLSATATDAAGNVGAPATKRFTLK